MILCEEESEFLEYCRSGYVTEALRKIFPSPQSKLKTGPVYSFADSLVNGTCLDAHTTNKYLTELLKKDGEDGDFLINDGILASLVMSTDESLYAYLGEQGIHMPLWFECLLSERLQRKLTQEDIEQSLTGLPQEHYQSLLERILYIQRRLDFQQRRTQLYESLMKGPLMPPDNPLYPLRYFASNSQQERIIKAISERGDKIPLIFMESLQIDWGKALETLSGHQTLFVFTNNVALWNALIDDDLYKSLMEKQHLILVLDHYPNRQLLAQDLRQMSGRDLYPVFVDENELLMEKESELVQAIAGCVNELTKDLKGESPAGNTLYGLGKSLNQSMKGTRLGESRAIAQHANMTIERWYDKRKKLVKPSWDKEVFRDILQKIPCRRERRPFVRKEKIRIAHIVPQIIDSNNAPQRLLRILFKGHCREKYELYLFSNEYMVPRKSEYPVLPVQSRPSLTRGADNLAVYESMGVKTYVDAAQGTFYEAAEAMACKLKEEEIDIAIFHESDAINLLTARLSNVPMHVFYQLSSHLDYEGFDLVISAAPPPSDQVDYYHSIGTKLQVIVPSVDYVGKWSKEAEKKSFFGVSEDASILTTISNHLENRLTVDMCHCISEILKGSPNAYYMPMGNVQNPLELKARFSPEIADRVIFLGPQAEPMHLSRSMTLYLNEFPTGSGFGMLDAMAGGCPVVSMGQGESGVGGAYFGMDRLVKTGKREDYIGLATRLLQDPQMYSEWSSYTRQQYQKIADEKAYVGDIEKTIESLL